MPKKVQDRVFSFLGTREITVCLRISKEWNTQTRRFLGEEGCAALYSGIRIGASDSVCLAAYATPQQALELIKKINQAVVSIFAIWFQADVKGFNPVMRQAGMKKIDTIARTTGWLQGRLLEKFLRQFQPLEYATKELQCLMRQNYAPCGLCPNDLFYFDYWLIRLYRRLLENQGVAVIEGVRRIFIKNMPNMGKAFSKYEGCLIVCKKHYISNAVVQKPVKKTTIVVIKPPGVK